MEIKKEQGELQQEEMLKRQEEELLKEERKKIKFDFIRKEYDYFCENCMFSELQEKILEDKIKKLSIIEISQKNDISEETVKKIVREIKDKILKVI